MSQNRLTDFLPVKEKDKITFLDLEVIDGKNLRDAKAFILPSFLEKINIEGFDSVAALESIRSFFGKVLEVVNSNLKEDEKIRKLKDLFRPIHEVSSLGLGYAHQGSNGHGPDYESLFQIGILMNHIIQLWEKENHSADLLFAKSLSIFVPNFGPDALSDLIAALIYPQLVEYTKFTLDQNKINYTLSDKTETVSGIPRSIWDSVNGKWVLYRQILIVKNLHLTLIPYELLTQYSKAFDVIRYLSVFLIKNLQNTNNSIKEEINYVGGKKNYITSISNKKEFALKYTESNIDAFNAFVQDPLNKGIGKELDDSKFKYDNSEDV